MRTNYRRDQRPDDGPIRLSDPALRRLAEQCPQHHRYEMRSTSLAQEMKRLLQPMIDASRLGRVTVSIYPRGNGWEVNVGFLPTSSYS